MQRHKTFSLIESINFLMDIFYDYYIQRASSKTPPGVWLHDMMSNKNQYQFFVHKYNWAIEILHQR